MGISRKTKNKIILVNFYLGIGMNQLTPDKNHQLTIENIFRNEDLNTKSRSMIINNLVKSKSVEIKNHINLRSRFRDRENKRISVSY